MIASVLPAAPPGRHATSTGGVRGGATGQAAFAALVVPDVAGEAMPALVDTDDATATATGRQDDAVAGATLPAAPSDGGGDTSWLSALFGSTALVQPATVRADPRASTQPNPLSTGTRTAVAPAVGGAAVITGAVPPTTAGIGDPSAPLAALDRLTPAAAAASAGAPDASPPGELPSAAASPPVVDQISPGPSVGPARRPDSPVAAFAFSGAAIPVTSFAEKSVVPGPPTPSATVTPTATVLPAPTASTPAGAMAGGPLPAVAITPSRSTRVDPAVEPIASAILPPTPSGPTIQDRPSPVAPRWAATPSAGDRPASTATTRPQTPPTAIAPPGFPSVAMAAASPMPMPLPLATASEVFAAAIHAAGERDREGAMNDDTASSMPLAGPAPPAIAPAQTGAGADPSLDMRRGNWPGAMIDHIEKLRDAADAVDTRVRLVPDALGGIDVSLRRHDDGVQVTLRADQPATQAMLADARPQLTAMAEARGIRLADAGPSSGGPGTGGDPSNAGNRQQPPTAPAAPASALAGRDIPAIPDPADGRVA